MEHPISTRHQKGSMIIAIDPGNEKSAYIAWNGQIVAKGIEDNNRLSSMLKHNTTKTGKQGKILVIEMIASYGMPVGKEIFETCVWIGRFIELWENKGLDYYTELIYRKDVKMHLCNSTRAKDSNIRQALIDRYGKPGTKKNPNIIYDDAEKKMVKDLWSALALAVTFCDSRE